MDDLLWSARANAATVMRDEIARYVDGLAKALRALNGNRAAQHQADILETVNRDVLSNMFDPQWVAAKMWTEDRKKEVA